MEISSIQASCVNHHVRLHNLGVYTLLCIATVLFICHTLLQNTATITEHQLRRLGSFLCRVLPIPITVNGEKYRFKLKKWSKKFKEKNLSEKRRRLKGLPGCVGSEHIPVSSQNVIQDVKKKKDERHWVGHRTANTDTICAIANPSRCLVAMSMDRHVLHPASVDRK
jgi:hypothetical protein